MLPRTDFTTVQVDWRSPPSARLLCCVCLCVGVCVRTCVFTHFFYFVLTFRGHCLCVFCFFSPCLCWWALNTAREPAIIACNCTVSPPVARCPWARRLNPDCSRRDGCSPCMVDSAVSVWMSLFVQVKGKLFRFVCLLQVEWGPVHLLLQQGDDWTVSSTPHA